jgi:hypothetical protein
MVLVPPSPLRRQAETSAALIVRAWMWPGAVGPSCGMACEDWQTLPSDSHSDDLSLSEMMRAKVVVYVSSRGGAAEGENPLKPTALPGSQPRDDSR